MSAPNFLTDSEFRSMTGAFYPTGYVFAMLVDEQAARSAAAQVAALSPQLASPQAIVEAFAAQAADAKQTPASIGREDQFTARFVALARRGCWGVLFKLPEGSDSERLKAVFTELGTGVAYDYGMLVIEEWVPPSPRVAALESNPV